MEKVSKLKYRGEERTIGSLRKMFVAMSEDLRVIFVKLADRIHNMKTLRFHPNPEKQRRIALETLNIYAPIADRLGIYEFKESLERECFRILYPSEFEAIRRQKDLLSAEQEIFIKEAKKLIKSILPETIPVYEISSRVKSSWGIYKKMQKKGYQRVQDIYDVFAIRVITDTIPHCYEIL
jgi:GTP pyrophosphokinase